VLLIQVWPLAYRANYWNPNKTPGVADVRWALVTAVYWYPSYWDTTIGLTRIAAFILVIGSSADVDLAILDDFN